MISFFGLIIQENCHARERSFCLQGSGAAFHSLSIWFSHICYEKLSLFSCHLRCYNDSIKTWKGRFYGKGNYRYPYQYYCSFCIWINAGKKRSPYEKGTESGSFDFPRYLCSDLWHHRREDGCCQHGQYADEHSLRPFDQYRILHHGDCGFGRCGQRPAHGIRRRSRHQQNSFPSDEAALRSARRKCGRRRHYLSVG